VECEKWPRASGIGKRGGEGSKKRRVVQGTLFGLEKNGRRRMVPGT